MNKQKKIVNYIDNKAFHTAFVERNESVNIALVKANLTTTEELSTMSHEDRKKLIIKAKQIDGCIPKISDYIGDSFLKMTTNIAYKHNFNRYPYKEEMICDGIIDCVKYVDSFDVEKENPFAYFTSAISNAFIRRIIKEKKQGYVKSKLLSSSSITVHDLQEQDEDVEYINAFKDYMSVYNNFDGSMFEKKVKEKTKVYSNATLEDFCG